MNWNYRIIWARLVELLAAFVALVSFSIFALTFAFILLFTIDPIASGLVLGISLLICVFAIWIALGARLADMVIRS